MNENDTPAQARMPIEMIKAVAAVILEVKKLGKEGNNTFARYRYTSVDQFFEALGPLMAKHGLVDVVDERATAVEVREVANDRGEVKRSAWLIADYDIILFHESGASYGPLRRSIQVPATGAQSFASAQSYVEKYFLRTLFKVPTGDVDEVDAMQPQELPAKQQVRIGRADAELIDSGCEMLGDTFRKGLFTKLKVERAADILQQDRDYVVKLINERLAKKAALAEAAE
jgi:hypothetical protein